MYLYCMLSPDKGGCFWKSSPVASWETLPWLIKSRKVRRGQALTAKDGSQAALGCTIQARGICVGSEECYLHRPLPQRLFGDHPSVYIETKYFHIPGTENNFDFNDR